MSDETRPDGSCSSIGRRAGKSLRRTSGVSNTPGSQRSPAAGRGTGPLGFANRAEREVSCRQTIPFSESLTRRTRPEPLGMGQMRAHDSFGGSAHSCRSPGTASASSRSPRAGRRSTRSRSARPVRRLPVAVRHSRVAREHDRQRDLRRPAESRAGAVLEIHQHAVRVQRVVLRFGTIERDTLCCCDELRRREIVVYRNCRSPTQRCTRTSGAADFGAGREDPPYGARIKGDVCCELGSEPLIPCFCDRLDRPVRCARLQPKVARRTQRGCSRRPVRTDLTPPRARRHRSRSIAGRVHLVLSVHAQLVVAHRSRLSVFQYRDAEAAARDAARVLTGRVSFGS